MKLTIRIQTELGPRSIVTQALAEVDARAIARTISSIDGWEASVQLDEANISLTAHMRKHRMKAKQKSEPNFASNVTRLPSKKVTK